MALSQIVYISDGATTQFPVNFALGILDRSDVTINVEGELNGDGSTRYRTVSWVNDGLINMLGGAAPTGKKVYLKRTVPKRSLVTDFQDNAIINEENLNNSQRQTMMAVHEALDVVAGFTPVETPGSGGGTGGIGEAPDDGKYYARRSKAWAVAPTGGTGGSTAWADVTGKPNSIAGYGIQNAYTKTEVDQKIADGGGGGGGGSTKGRIRIPNVWDFGATGTNSTADQTAGTNARVDAGNNRPIYMDYGNFDLDPLVTNCYGNDYRDADGTGMSMYQGTAAAPSTDPDPVLKITKVTNMNMSAGRTWDSGAAFFGVEKNGGDGFVAACTGLAIHTGGTNDAIGGHFRAIISNANDKARGWGLWGYTANYNTVKAPWHACELNGSNHGADPGWLGVAQCLRVCMSDNDQPNNRMSTGISIGASTTGGDNGFYSGLVIEAQAVLPTAGEMDNGEAIIFSGPGATVTSIGGVRAQGSLKYAFRCNEANIVNNMAMLLGKDHKIQWISKLGPAISSDGTNINVSVPVGVPKLSVNGILIDGASDQLSIPAPVGIAVSSGDALRMNVNTAVRWAGSSGPAITSDGATINMSVALGAPKVSIGGIVLDPAGGQLSIPNVVGISVASQTDALRINANTAIRWGSGGPAIQSNGVGIGFTTHINVPAGSNGGVLVGGVQVLGQQQGNVPTAGTAASMETIRNVLNAVVGVLRGHGLTGSAGGVLN